MSAENTHKSYKWFRLQRKLAPYMFILPGTSFFILGVFLPMIIGVMMSFTDWTIISPTIRFVGFANYQRMFADAKFWLVLKNTFTYAIILVPGVIIIGFLMALLLNTKIRGMVFFRTIYYLPVVTPVSVAAVIWMWLYDFRIGPLNWILRSIGIAPQRWLTDPSWAMVALIAMAIWRQAGTKMIIYLAALLGIPQSIYEAADIDGAGPLQRLFYITIPLLSPTTLFVVVTTTMEALRIYAEVNIMTQGGPLNRTASIVLYIFDTAFSDMRMGYAAAMSVALFVITIIITLINWKTLGKDVHYGG